ncbi:MAG: sensor histidine kinase [Coprobacillus sp.]
MRKVKIRNFSISIYLMLFVIGTVIVVAFLLTLSFFQIFKESMTSFAMTNAEQSITQVSDTIGNYSSVIKHNMDNIVSTVSLAENQSVIEEHTKTMVDINDDIVSIILYDENGKILQYQGKYSLKKNIETNLSFNKAELDKTSDYSISAPHVQSIFEQQYPWVVTIAQKKWAGSYGKEVYVTMDIRFSSMATNIDNVGIGQHGYCYIANNQGEIIYHPLQQLIYLDIKKENNEIISELGQNTKIYDGTIYASKEVPNFNWKVVGVSYVSELVDSKVATATTSMISILFVVILCASILVFALSRKLTKPIRSLVSAMNEFEKNAIDFKYSPTLGVSEFNKLSHSFEHMVVQIQELMERVKSEEIILRKTELKALQAQINPHFLYNTLDSIQWMCEREKTEDAIKMVSALAQLFRISISKGYELIPIEKEIQHAKNYLVIQSYRYKDQFEYTFDIDEEVLPYFCHKITLQPIIENALYHGISRMIDEGKIVITAKKEGNDILFTISDNGIGMTSEQVTEILRKELTDSKGIGVKNVNDRIKIYFGEEYGITVNSELDVGTTITIRIPAIMEEYYSA